MNRTSQPDRGTRFRARHFFVGLLAASTAASAAQAPAAAPAKFDRAKIKSVVAAMTLEEKAALVVGEGGGGFGPPPGPGAPGAPAASPAAASAPNTPPVTGILGATQRLVPGAAGTTYAVPRLGIGNSVLADGPAGLRISPTRPSDQNTYYATGFPVGTLLASTWDPDLVTRVGKAMGNEVLEYGVDVLLAPGMNIQRNPLCGRNFEYYSEDPLLTGKMAAAMVNGVESQGVGTSIKHFAANNAETARTALDTNVSERALREIYLEGFRIAVQDAQPWTIMTSYNLINGTYTSESRDLITSVLRGDWGFKGLVMTDWGGGKDPIAQMAAGNDLIMPGRPAQRDTIVKAVKEGKLDVKLLDANVERILNGLAETPRYKGYAFSNKPDLKAHAAVAREAASEGMILLKNAGAALPLGPQTKTVAAFGNATYETFAGGTGSGDVNKAYTVSIAQGLSGAGYQVNADLASVYSTYLKLVKAGRPAVPGRGLFRFVPIAEMDIPNDLVTSMAELSDVGVVTIGRNAGEGRDRTNTEGDFKLTEAERRMIQQVSAAFKAKGKKSIVVMNIGGSIETASWRDQPDAILLAWQGGQEVGNVVADILSGKVNPSGKLAATFVMDYMDVPSAKTFPGQEIPGAPVPEGPPGPFQSPKPSTITYEDGIYVGYRYYDTFGVKAAYPFGYGLSYTTFDYATPKLSALTFDKRLVVTVDVKNTGKVAGREVAQLYLTAPEKSLDKPAKELKGFAKTKLLAPGETQTLEFVLDPRSLASFDPTLSAWVAESGKYEVKVGASSADIRQTASFSLPKELVVKKEARALVPKQKIAEIKPPARH
ncbi:MAG: glycoside hydrolase family 3 N-terminal domain-containing protein [Vicinamibacteria bacterium]